MRWAGCLVLVGTLLLAACTRSDADIARERRTLRAALDVIPPVAGVRAYNDYADFHSGCRGFSECVDGGDTPASYAVPLHLDPAAGANPAAQCRHFRTALARHGIRLVTVWRGTRATHATTTTLPASWYGDNVRPRWVDVTDQVCASGHVHSAVLVDRHGGSPATTAHLVLRLFDYNGNPPSYQAVAEPARRGHDPAGRRVGRLPVDTPPLTTSEQAYLDARLDRPFVIAADPAADGIRTDGKTVDTWTLPPAVTTLRFEVTCTRGDVVSLGVWDAGVDAAPRGSGRTEDCTAQPLHISLPAPAPAVTVSVSVRQRPLPASPVPASRHHAYTVRVTPHV